MDWLALRIKLDFDGRADGHWAAVLPGGMKAPVAERFDGRDPKLHADVLANKPDEQAVLGVKVESLSGVEAGLL